jgi:hypothetical protein
LDGSEQIGRDHASAFHGDEAWEAFQEAMAIVRRHPDWGDRLVVLARRASSIVALRGGSFRGQPQMAVVDRLIDEALVVAKDPHERAGLLLAKGAMYIRRAFPAQRDDKSLQDRLDAVREASAIAEQMDPALRFSVADTLTDIYIAA